MAYCKNCGAYLPDGQSVCVACGFDEAASAAGTAAAAAGAYSATNNDLREQLEQHRREQKEKSERWAEEEYARRQQQESNRQWAREEYARRQAEREEQERRLAEERRKIEEQRRQAQEERRKIEEERRQEEARRRAAAASAYRSMGSSDQGAGKILGALSYLSFLWVLPYIFTPNDYFAKFHARQGLKLFFFGILADVVGGLTGFGWIISLFRFYLIYKGMSAALNNREEPLPYIGTIGDN